MARPPVIRTRREPDVRQEIRSTPVDISSRATRFRTVVAMNGRRYAQASTEDIERLRDLNLARLLTCINGEWFIDDGPLGTPPIGDVIEHQSEAPDPNGHSERRRDRRGTADSEPSRSKLVATIIGTYREMPGLSLHIPQAARLFGIRPRTCGVVLEDLVSAGELRKTVDGQYTMPWRGQ